MSQRIEREPEIMAAVKPARDHRRDIEAFTHFYREHLGYVRHVVAHLGVPHAVDDVVQETFVIAYRRFTSLRPEASSRAWLAAIARRTAYRWRRTILRGVRRTHALRTLTHAVPPDPGRMLDASRFLERFLESLDTDKRDVFVMAEVAQLPAPEIAHTLGLNPNTVYTRLRASRMLLAAAAEQEGLRCTAAALESAHRIEEPTPSQMRAGWLLLVPKLGGAPSWMVGMGAVVAGWVGRPALRWAAALGFATFVGTGAAGYGHAEDPLRSADAHPIAAAGGVVDSLRGAPGPQLEQSWLPLRSGAELERSRETLSREEQQSARATRGGSLPARHEPSREGQGGTPAAVSPGPASIASETALLEHAVAELSSQPRRALALARQHARQFPGSQLEEVRAAVEVRALCGLGRTEQARAKADRFMQSHRGSNIAQIVARACVANSDL